MTQHFETNREYRDYKMWLLQEAKNIVDADCVSTGSLYSLADYTDAIKKTANDLDDFISGNDQKKIEPIKTPDQDPDDHVAITAGMKNYEPFLTVSKNGTSTMITSGTVHIIGKLREIK